MKRSKAEEYSDSLREHGNSERARQNAAYLKNRFTLFGVDSKTRKTLQKELLKSAGEDGFRELARLLYSMPERELHYTAIDLLVKYRKYLDIKDLPWIDTMIMTNSWWDSVDSLAVNVIGHILKNSERRKISNERYAGSDNMWMNRTAILFQLKYKEDTDFEYLCELADRFKGEKEFFIRKAIGWALREYSKTNPKAVTEYVEKASLSPLSEREAMKVIRRS